MNKLEQMRSLIISYRDAVGLKSDVEINDNMVIVDEWIYISETKVLRKTIKGAMEVDGWNLGKLVVIPGTSDSFGFRYPDDQDINTVAQIQSPFETAKNAILLVVENIIDSSYSPEADCLDEHDIRNNLKE
jgi:hypothetical protein